MDQLPNPQENSLADFRIPSQDTIQLPSVPKYSPADFRLKALPGQPQIVADPLPLAHRVCLYQRYIKTGPDQVKEIISLKTHGGIADCGRKQQNIIRDIAMRGSQDEVHPWDWNSAICVGKYIASGLTQLEDLVQAITLTDKEFGAVKSFLPNDDARSTSIPICQGAYERFLENRNNFFERVKLEDETRHARQNMPAPLRYYEGSEPGQGVLVGLAAQESVGASMPEGLLQWYLGRRVPVLLV